MSANITGHVALATDASPGYRNPKLASLGIFHEISFFVSLDPPQQPDSPILFILGSGQLTDDDAVFLYDLDGESWREASQTCGDSANVAIVDGRLNATICHLTQFAVFSNFKGGSTLFSGKSDAKSIPFLVICIGVVGFIALLAAALVLVFIKRRKDANKETNDLPKLESQQNQFSEDDDDIEYSIEESVPASLKAVRFSDQSRGSLSTVSLSSSSSDAFSTSNAEDDSESEEGVKLRNPIQEESESEEELTRPGYAREDL
jgi:hypothetical protein